MAFRKDDPSIRWYRRKQDPTWSARADRRYKVYKCKLTVKRKHLWTSTECGLHIHYNLQSITPSENTSKGSKYNSNSN